MLKYLELVHADEVDDLHTVREVRNEAEVPVLVSHKNENVVDGVRSFEEFLQNFPGWLDFKLLLGKLLVELFSRRTFENSARFRMLVKRNYLRHEASARSDSRLGSEGAGPGLSTTHAGFVIIVRMSSRCFSITFA